MMVVWFLLFYLVLGEKESFFFFKIAIFEQFLDSACIHAKCKSALEWNNKAHNVLKYATGNNWKKYEILIQFADKTRKYVVSINYSRLDIDLVRN